MDGVKLSILCLFVSTHVFLFVTAEHIEKESSRSRRDIPIAGQALQATSQVLNHPIVAAALQKISMDALATVASALNQVNQEERAKKSNIEMARTLDKMASLRKQSEHHMPMLEDSTGGGSGDEEDTSGSGSGDESDSKMVNQSKTNKTATSEGVKRDDIADDKNLIKLKKRHHHHHHHHHHHRHHGHHKHHHHHHKHHHEKKSEPIREEKQNSTTNEETTGNSMSKFDWSSIKDNRTVVDTIAMHANIPARKLLEIIESGASRSDISKQTEVLLNRTVSNQADLAALYRGEELTPDDDPQIRSSVKGIIKKPSTMKKEKLVNSTVDEKPKNFRNKTKDYVIPKEIPSSCGKLVKAYTNGEMTLRDYLKELNKCKKEEATAKRLANTTPEQREAVATENVINEEAYKYALHTMTKKGGTKEGTTKTANDVMDKWRANSFGTKKSETSDTIPDTVKNFMTVQSSGNVPADIHRDQTTLNIKSPETAHPDSYESAKSLILNHVMGKGDNSLVDYKTKSEAGFQDALYKRNNVPQNSLNSAFTNSAVINRLKSMDPISPQVQLDNANFFPNLQNVQNSNLQLNKILAQKAAALANMAKLKNMKRPIGDTVAENLIAKQTLIARSSIPKPQQKPETDSMLFKKSEIPNTAGGALLQKHLLAQQQGELPVKGPQTLQQTLQARTNIRNNLYSPNLVPNTQTRPFIPNQLTSINPTLMTNEVAKLNPALPENPVLDNSKSLIPSVTASTIFGDENLKNENKNLLNGQELAAERIIASLANPVLKDIPVDNSLVAALNEMAGPNKDSLESDPKQSIAMATFMKRQVSDSRKHKKRQLSEPAEIRHPRKRDISDVIAKRHKRHHVKNYGKRDTSDKIKSAKAIERSKMGLPLTSVQQGPKLMDKIRDMSRVIATP